MSDEQWNIPTKDLFSMLEEVKKEFSKLSNEMSETRGLIKKYNGLREEVGKYRDEIEKLERKISALEAKAEGRFSVFTGIREWGGWLFGGCSLLISAISLVFAFWKLNH